MGTPATLDDVLEAVCNSRAEGDEALAATALLLGAAMLPVLNDGDGRAV